MSEDPFENGPENTHVVQAFQDLRSNDPDKRHSAIEMLIVISPSTMAATPLPILLTALDHPNARVRKAVATALGLKGDRTAIPRLMNLLQDKWVRETAVRALGHFGLPALLPILQGKDVVLRRVAVTTLGTIGNTTVIPKLLEALKDEDQTVRRAAAEALGVIGDASTAPALVKVLTDREWEVKRAAEEVLVRMGTSATKAVVNALNDTDRTIRLAASEILERFGDQVALSDLLDVLHNKDRYVRRAAVSVLGSRSEAEVVPALISALNDKDSTVRLAVVDELMFIGDASAIPKLLAVWRSDGQQVQEAATIALQRLCDKSNVPIFLDALNDENSAIRLDSVRILGAIADGAVVPRLVNLLNDPDAKMRVTTTQALGRIGDAKAIPGLLNALSDPNSEVRIEVINTLNTIGDSSAIPGLLTALRDPAPRVRLDTVKALRQFRDTRVVSGLLEALHDKESYIRAAAAETLGRIGDPLAIEGLIALLSDKESIYGDVVPPTPSGIAFIFEENESQVEPLASGIPLIVNEAATQALSQIGRSVDQKTVLFSAYYPKEVSPQIWYPLHLYCYDIIAIKDVMADVKKQLSTHLDEYRQTSEKARGRISEGALITATPNLEGFQFNPPSVTVGFFEDWHRLDFKLRAGIEWREKASNGFVTFTVEGIIVADLPLSIFVSDQGSVIDIPGITRRSYQTIFCSYSHHDEQIVRHVEHVYKALGMDYLRDITTLKSGQLWNEELLAMIERADIFQLFWSKNSASSTNVEKEWRHALQLDREQSQFIRPVYWILPMPDAPKDLANIHFSYDPDLGT